MTDIDAHDLCTALERLPDETSHGEPPLSNCVENRHLGATGRTALRFDVPYMEHVCNVIGNALPCNFAAVVSRQCYETLTGATL